jgi:hypothetical protein
MSCLCAATHTAPTPTSNDSDHTCRTIMDFALCQEHKVNAYHRL